MNLSRGQFALFLMAMVAMRAEAGDGAVEINQDCVAVGCFAGDSPGYPVTITEPGTYMLTSDLAPPGSAFTDAISIPQATPVDIDLGGHTINGGASCGGTPYVVDCTPALGRSGFQIGGEGLAVAVHIHHGRISGFTEGVQGIDLGTGTQFDGLTMTDNLAGLKVQAVEPDVDVRISNSLFSRNRFVGIGRYTGDTRIDVENCVVSQNGANGIEAANSSTFVNNRINRNQGVGIACNFSVGAVCAVGGNTLYGNNGGGPGNPTSPQWTIDTARVLGSNVCMDDNTCP